MTLCKAEEPQSCRTGRRDFAPGLYLSDLQYFYLIICRHWTREFTVSLKQAFYFPRGDALGLGCKAGSFFFRAREKNSSIWNREPTKLLHCCLLSIWSHDSETPMPEQIRSAERQHVLGSATAVSPHSMLIWMWVCPASLLTGQGRGSLAPQHVSCVHLSLCLTSYSVHLLIQDWRLEKSWLFYCPSQM